MVTDTIVDTVPIQLDADGVYRISGTRVTLDSVVLAFNQGATPEEIAYRFPPVPLADVYATLAYYLRNQSVIEKYLLERQQLADIIRRENEFRFPPEGIRERLIARQTHSSHAPLSAA